MNLSDFEQDDIWIYKPLKRQKKVECTQTATTATSTLKNFPLQKRQSNNFRSRGPRFCSTATSDESSSSSFIDVNVDSGQNEGVKHIPPLSSFPSSQKTSTCNLSNSNNKSKEKSKAKTRHPKKSTNVSSVSTGKKQTTNDLMETNVLSRCPICQISSAIFLNRDNLQKWFTHISSCLESKSVSENVKGWTISIFIFLFFYLSYS